MGIIDDIVADRAQLRRIFRDDPDSTPGNIDGQRATIRSDARAAVAPKSPDFTPWWTFFQMTPQPPSPPRPPPPSDIDIVRLVSSDDVTITAFSEQYGRRVGVLKVCDAGVYFLIDAAHEHAESRAVQLDAYSESMS